MKNEIPLPPELQQFWEEREQLNAIVMEMADLPIKRFLAWMGKHTGKVPCQ